jgi:metal-dependent amidase/aminoacylase/carboxypeptidase family protein
MKLFTPLVISSGGAAEIAAIRRDIHANPELCFQENQHRQFFVAPSFFE